MSILIVSDFGTDGHITPVAAELGHRGHQIMVFNPARFPLSIELRVDSSQAGPRAVITWENEDIDLSQVGSVWFRRPGGFVLPEELSVKEVEWLRSECAAFVNGMYAVTDALWVNEPHKNQRADLKLLQLSIAQRLGFRVPAYTVTNSPEHARVFIEAHPDGVIIKGMRMPTLLLDDRAAMMYTHRVTETDLEQIESVRYGPTFLQSLIPKARDIRVTIIGDELFAVGIESMSMAEARIDFREVDIMDLPHVPITLPEPVALACRKVLRELGLQFGAIDLLETPDGDYVFLENNPNGQWYWIELMTGLPMARAMADLLERGEIERGRAPDVGRGFTPAPRRPRVLNVGSQSVPLSETLDDARDDGIQSEIPAHMVATRAWLQRKKRNVVLHVGDTAADVV